MKNIAIIVAAGNSTRFNCDIPKQYFIVNGRSVLNWTVRAFLASNFIDNILVVINKEHKDLYYNSIDEFDVCTGLLAKQMHWATEYDSAHPPRTYMSAAC